MLDQLSYLLGQLPNLLIGFPGSRPGGLLLSIWLAVVAIAIGFVIALFIGSATQSRWAALRGMAFTYIYLFRGLPLLLLLLLIHQLIGLVPGGFSLSPRVSAYIALTLYSSAYQAEIVRAGLQTVPQNLVEASRMLGYDSAETFRKIKLPYLIRTMTPAFLGEAISLFKDTSVVIVLGVTELMTVARVGLGSSGTTSPYWLGMYLLVGALYFTVAFAISQFAQRYEQRAKVRNLVYSLSNY